jgi:hypothetical protein
MGSRQQRASGNPRRASRQTAGPLPTRVLIEAMAEEEERLLTNDLLTILAGSLRPCAAKAADIELRSVEP